MYAWCFISYVHHTGIRSLRNQRGMKITDNQHSLWNWFADVNCPEDLKYVYWRPTPITNLRTPERRRYRTPERRNDRQRTRTPSRHERERTRTPPRRHTPERREHRHHQETSRYRSNSPHSHTSNRNRSESSTSRPSTYRSQETYHRNRTPYRTEDRAHHRHQTRSRSPLNLDKLDNIIDQLQEVRRKKTQ